MKRTTVFADEGDLAVIKAAATRRGVAEAEIIRDAIHLAAMASRSWSEPFFTRTFTSDGCSPPPPARDVLDDAVAEKAAAYRRTKRTAR